MTELPVSGASGTIVDRYKSDRGFIKKFLEKLPLYSSALGNHEYESADLLIRKEVADKLVTYKELLRQTEENFVKKNLLTHIGKTEPAVSLIDKMAMSIRSASYGLTGIGTGFKPTDVELQALTTLDGALLTLTQEMQTKFQETLDAVKTNPDEAESRLDGIIKELQLIEKSFQERKTIFTGLKK